MRATEDGLPFSIESRSIGRERVRLAVSGELDVASSPFLRRDLSRELGAGHDVELDISRLDFIDSSGISVVLQAIDEFDAENRSFALAPQLTDQVRRLLSLIGLLPLL